MFKTEITTEDNRTIYLEYDKSEYNIEYNKSENIFILRRIEGNKVLETFSDKIGFIVQVYSYDKFNFIVTDYSEENKIYFKHYGETLGARLKLINKFECDSASIEKCRITDSSFIVEQEGYSGTVYCLNGKSKRFDYIYNEKKINEIIGENILIVSQVKEALCNPAITDRITYGINPESFNIVTSIWSELQQRSIKVKDYTSEVAEAIKSRELIDERRHYLIPSRDRYMLEEATMDLEVWKYLNMLAECLNKTEKTSFDYMKSEINESFLKKFIRK